MHVRCVLSDPASNVRCQHMSTLPANKLEQTVSAATTMVRKSLLEVGLVPILEIVILVIDNVRRKLAVIILHVYAALNGVGFVEQSTEILEVWGMPHIRNGADIMHSLQVG